MDQQLEDAWKTIQPRLLFPLSLANPYYIVASRWTSSSAGVRALHLLCHALNRSGHKAYLIYHPFDVHPRSGTNNELFTPILEEAEARDHLRRQLTPIVLYPEVVFGNPLQAPVVARWILNFPGLLGGDSVYADSEMCFGYSRELAIAAGSPDQVLYLPTIDTRIFYPAHSPGVRSGACFCASKYKAFHNGVLDPITDNCFEITRHQPDSPTPRELADLLRRSDLFYAYENTALITEALLCGCPSVLIPNPSLTEMIGREELGTDGIAWGTDPVGIARARATVEQGVINYLRTYDLFWEQLARFIQITQERAAGTPYPELIALPSWPPKGIRRYALQMRKETRRLTRKLMNWFGLEPR